MQSAKQLSGTQQGAGKHAETPAVPWEPAMETVLSKGDPAHVASESTIAPFSQFSCAESQNSCS